MDTRRPHLAAALAAFTCGLGATGAYAQPVEQRHDWQLGIALDYVAVTTGLGAWPERGVGKLRFD